MDDLTRILKALADENRLTIIGMLLTHDLCVGALSEHLDISEAAVSQHLKVLRGAGLVTGEKRGYYTHYMVNRDLIRQTAGELAHMAEQSREELRCGQKSGHTCCQKEQ